MARKVFRQAKVKGKSSHEGNGRKSQGNLFTTGMARKVLRIHKVKANRFTTGMARKIFLHAKVKGKSSHHGNGKEGVHHAQAKGKSFHHGNDKEGFPPCKTEREIFSPREWQWQGRFFAMQK